jgi:hypothetical protein
MSRTTRRKSAGATVEAYGNEWTDCAPADDEDVAAASKALGLKIPHQAAKLFKTCAGGRPKRNFHDGDTGEIVIGYVLPLRKVGRREDLVTTCRRLRQFQKTFRDHLLPFAYDNGNANLLCIDTKTDEVVYWLHDNHDHPVRSAAPSLNEFLSGLSPAPF